MNCFETGVIGPCMSSKGYKEKNFTMKIKSGFYITEDGELMVVFGGGIILSAAAYENTNGQWEGELAMSEDGQEHEIGEDLGQPDVEDFNRFHPVRLKFYDKESIDVLINQLQQIKNFDHES